MNKTEQIKELLLRGGSISNFEAFEQFNVTRLGSVIFELRTRHGLDIVTDIVQVGSGSNAVRFARYRLSVASRNMKTI